MVSSVLYYSTGFMGYAPEIYELIWHHEVQDTDDDQLYYTKLYLDEDIRVSRIGYVYAEV